MSYQLQHLFLAFTLGAFSMLVLWLLLARIAMKLFREDAHGYPVDCGGGE